MVIGIERVRSLVPHSTAESKAKQPLVGDLELSLLSAGRAWITGTRQLMLDPTDPWPEGYRIGDTWPVLRESEPTTD